jgi:serine/threonine-protein kinase
MDAMVIGPTATCMPRTVSGHPTPETVIDDRYLMERRIGVGATAVVYRAKDLLLRRNVSIKLLHDWFAEDDEVVERFRREASTASGLHDPHIVAVYESGEWDGRRYIVMEYAAGRSLKSLIRESAPLVPAGAIDLTVQLLRAVGYIHGRGIIHRDLKPENAVLAANGQLKLIDFGIARLHESDVTQTGAIIGTAQYLSPEQIHGEPASVASDLYAIGIILYELLTGRVPFDGDTIAAVLHGHIRGQPTSPGSLNPAVIPQLDSVAIRALAKNPRERFVNAGTFIAALEHVATNLTPHNSMNVTRAA